VVPYTTLFRSKNEEGAGIDMLETVKAVSMFAMKVQIEEWFMKISSDEVKEVTEIVKEDTETRKWVNEKKAGGENVLPILIQHAEGHERLFYNGGIIQALEKVIYLKHLYDS